MTVVPPPAEKLTDGTIAWRLSQLERSVDELEAKVDRLVWSFALAALSFAGASATLVIVVVSGGAGSA